VSWAGRIMRFVDEDQTTVRALQPVITYGVNVAWEGRHYTHACEACELSAWVELLAAAATLALAPAGRPDQVTLRLRPAPGLRALATWSAGEPAGGVAWEHNEVVCPAPGTTVDELLDRVREDLAATGGSCRKQRQGNCVVAALVAEVERLRAELARERADA
jgi:hypothetical protein